MNSVTNTLLTGADLLTPRWSTESLKEFFSDHNLARARSWQKIRNKDKVAEGRNYRVGELLVGPLIWVGDRDAIVDAAPLEAVAAYGREIEEVLQLGDSREPNAPWIGPATEMVSAYFHAGASAQHVSALITGLSLRPGHVAQALLLTLRDYRADSRLKAGYPSAWRAFTPANAGRFSLLIGELGREDLEPNFEIDLAAAKQAAYEHAVANGHDWPDR